MNVDGIIQQVTYQLAPKVSFDFKFCKRLPNVNNISYIRSLLDIT